MIELGLRALLLAQAGITALAPAQPVNGSNCDAVFNETEIQGFAPPFIVIEQTGFDPMVCLDGTYGMQATEFEIGCYATSKPAALTLAKTVNEFLRDYAGAAGADDRIDAVIQQGKRNSRFLTQTGTDARHHVVTVSYLIQHTEV